MRLERIVVVLQWPCKCHWLAHEGAAPDTPQTDSHSWSGDAGSAETPWPGAQTAPECIAATNRGSSGNWKESAMRAGVNCAAAVDASSCDKACADDVDDSDPAAWGECLC